MKKYWVCLLVLCGLFTFTTAQAQKQEAEQLTEQTGEADKPGKVFRDCPDCPEMVEIPAGSFDMGSSNLEVGHQNDETPQHRVNVKAFALGKYEVTMGQFAAFIHETGLDDDNDCYASPGKGNWRNPGFPQSDNQPVVCVNWNEAQAYAQWLSKKTGKQYRLPSEAEWEYAARAGTTTARYWGNDIGHGNANCDGCGSQWDDKQTAPAGSFAPNTFGLYDMLGNAGEWVDDSYHESYNGAPADGSTWDGGNSERHVFRGGSWFNLSQATRSASRDRHDTAYRDSSGGFRLARILP